MKKLYITADFNDADYSYRLIVIDEETFDKFLPLIKAINNFEPYVRRSRYGGVDYNNWEGHREDLGEMPLEEKYSQFDKKYIEEFQRTFVSPIPVPYEGSEDMGPHTIVELVDVMTDEVLIDTKEKYSKHNDKVDAYLKEKAEIYSYTRKSDGKPLHSIPFVEMTDEEHELIERAHNLWKKYI
jgi:hypothetical protein